MGKFADGIKASLRARQKKKPKESVKNSYAYLSRKLAKAMKDYEKQMTDVLSVDGNSIHPKQKSMFESLEYVRQVTAQMILDLDLLRNDGWKP